MTTPQATPSGRESLLADLAALDNELTRRAERHLHDFVRQSWTIVETQRPFKDNWHVGAICEHLEAVVLGQIQNLGINVPPSTGKSTIVSVQFPAWVWARRADRLDVSKIAAARVDAVRRRLGPAMRFMCASYDQAQSTRDNMRMRDLVLSDWYQERWSLDLREDQNLKLKFATTSGGWRIGMSVGAPRMGEHPNYKIIDDPHNPKKQLLSDAEILAANNWYDYSMKTRGAMIGASTVLVMQRLHEKDLCGHLRETDGDAWHWLVLPMRWEPKRMVELPTGWRDPREGHPGALLWPSEWSAAKVDATYKPGTWGDASQFQQRPSPAGGLMFKRSQFRVVNALPAGIVARVRSWDVASTAEEEARGGTARTAGVRVERTADGLFVVTDVRKGWWSPGEVDANMAQVAQLDGPTVAIREEQEPGGSGKAVIDARRRRLAGYNYRGLPKRADKITAAKPARSQCEGGNVAILIPLGPDGSPDQAAQRWVTEFLDEIEVFPAGSLKDQVDAFTQAVNVLTGVAEPLDISAAADAPDPAAQERAARDYLRAHGIDPDALDAADTAGIEDLLS